MALQLSLYDFDGTIYQGDATRDFWIYCIKKYKRQFYKVPSQLWMMLLWQMGWCETEKVKEKAMCLVYWDHVARDVSDFWASHHTRIFPWVHDAIREDQTQQRTVICISASPNFLLQPMVKVLGMDDLICSRMHEGRMIGKNCKGQEKLARLKAWAKGRPFQVCKMASDSTWDLPLYNIAEEKIWVNHHGKRFPGTPPNS